MRIVDSLAVPTPTKPLDETLRANWEVKRINRCETYSGDYSGPNQAEVYLPLHRIMTDQHHGVSPRSLSQHAYKAALKELRRMKISTLKKYPDSRLTLAGIGRAIESKQLKERGTKVSLGASRHRAVRLRTAAPVAHDKLTTPKTDAEVGANTMTHAAVRHR